MQRNELWELGTAASPSPPQVTACCSTHHNSGETAGEREKENGGTFTSPPFQYIVSVAVCYYWLLFLISYYVCVQVKIHKYIQQKIYRVQLSSDSSIC